MTTEYHINQIFTSIKHYEKQIKRENEISSDLRKHEDVALFESCIVKLKKQLANLLEK